MEHKFTWGVREPIEIRTPYFGVTLRQFEVGDSEAIFNLINENRDHLSQFGDTTSEKYPDLESVRESIEKPKNEKRLRFGIWNDKNELVGSINLTPDEDNPQKGEVGYYLGSEFTNKKTKKNYIVNSVLALTSFAFTNLGYVEIYATTHPENVASQKVLLKSGFTETGEKGGDKLFTLKKL